MTVRTRRALAALSSFALFATGAATAKLIEPASAGPHAASELPCFSKVVSLSHISDPRTTPIFPGNPKFTIRTAFTVPEDGYYL
jgi:hypothetical protein